MTEFNAIIAKLDYRGMSKQTARELRGEIGRLLCDKTVKLDRAQRHTLRIELRQLAAVAA